MTSKTSLFLAVCVGFLLNCGGTTTTFNPLETDPVSDIDPKPTSLAFEGPYDGYYSCPQGKTAMHLDFSRGPEGDSTAIFYFGPHQENPHIPSGSFHMRGSVTDDGQFELHANEGDWIEHPKDYFVVGMKGVFKGNEARGEITNAECSTFYLRRASQFNR